MKFSRVNEVVKQAGRNLIKVLRLGSNDVQTPIQVANFGIDSAPFKNMVAIHSSTGIEGESIVIGYIKEDAIAEVGETHLYSTDTDGVDSFRVKLLTDGTCEIGGNTDNAVRFSELETAYEDLQGTVNDLIDSYNTHIHTTTATVGPSAVLGAIAPTTSQEIPNTGDISGAKIEEIKVP